ncbi:MAG TPA: hypothetical protein VF456_25420 [Vicinamibacterales bacterium]
MMQRVALAVGRRVQITSLSILAILVANPLLAQSAQTGNPSMISPVYVRNINGAEIHGQLLQLGPDTLSLLDKGTVRDVRLADVARIESRGDSVKNGAIIGAAILGGWCALICPQGLDGYRGQFASVLAINTALGATIGAGIDAMHVGRTTIYEPADIQSARRSSGVKAFFSKRFRF